MNKEINIELKKVNWKHAEAVCNARLIELGYETFFPFTGGTEIDLIAIKGEDIKRIQIKSVSPKKDKINIRTYRSNINYKKHTYQHYKNIDWFLVYDGTNIYKIDSGEPSVNICLRYTLPKNNQSEGIKMASDYIL